MSETIKNRITKLEQEKGVTDRSICVILRSKDSENPWGFRIATNDTTRDLTIDEVLELLYLQYIKERPIGYPFKAVGNTFHNFVVAFDEYAGFKHPEQRKQTIDQIREHGYTPPKPSLLPPNFVELTITNNKDPTDFLKG